MAQHYHVVPHDGGWTYKVGEVFAETYPTKEAALAAARRAAGEQRVPTEPANIQYEDENGVWRIEHVDGRPPETDVS
ncbi:MAG: DUF2188 domain-containing protein [Hyphomonadaceae bacterium]